MSVKYRKVINNRKGSSTIGKIYGKAVVSGTVTTKKLAEEISEMCTVTPPDTIAVIKALDTQIGKHLANGERVVLDDFGAFKVGITTKPADTPKKFTANNVVGTHVIFQPAIEIIDKKRVKTMLKGVTVEEQTEYESLKDGSTSPTNPGGNTDDKGGSQGGGSQGGGSSSSDGDGTVE